MMKHDIRIVLAAFLVMIIAAVVLWFGHSIDRWYQPELYQAGQSRTLGSTQIDNLTFDATNAAVQVKAVGRGATSPQTSNTYSSEQIANLSYDATNGAVQVMISTASEDLVFTNISGLTDGQYLQYDGVTDLAWENVDLTLNDVTYLNISSTSPYLKGHNTTHEDTDGGREFLVYAEGEQSGGEVSRLAELEMSHSGSSDDEKGKILIKINDGNDGESPGTLGTIDADTVSFQALTDSTTFFQILDVDGGDPVLNVDSTSELVGIGLDNPTLKLHIKGNSGWAQIKMEDSTKTGIRMADTGAGTDLKYIQFYNDGGVSSIRTLTDVEGVKDTILSFNHTTGESTFGTAGVVFKNYTSDPCGTLSEGAFWYNDTADIPCYCDASNNDLKFSDNSACF